MVIEEKKEYFIIEHITRNLKNIYDGKKTLRRIKPLISIQYLHANLSILSEEMNWLPLSAMGTLKLNYNHDR